MLPLLLLLLPLLLHLHLRTHHLRRPAEDESCWEAPKHVKERWVWGDSVEREAAGVEGVLEGWEQRGAEGKKAGEDGEGRAVHGQGRVEWREMGEGRARNEGEPVAERQQIDVGEEVDAAGLALVLLLLRLLGGCSQRS